MNEGDRLTEVAEEMAPGLRVDNIGMPGWGIDLMVRAVERFGSKAQADVVVLAIYSDDFRRAHPDYMGQGYALPRFRLRDGELIDTPYPAATWISRTRLRWVFVAGAQAADPHQFPLHDAILARFLDQSQRMGFIPAVFFVPPEEDVDVDVKRRAFLPDWAAKNSVAYSDSTVEVQTAEDTYIGDNWHWNELGHRNATSALGRLIASTGLKPLPMENPKPAPWPQPGADFCADLYPEDAS